MPKHWVMGVDKPDDIDVIKHIGRTVAVLLPSGARKKVEIEAIRGNLTHPTKFEIDAKGETYLISMLDFFGQMNGEPMSDADIKLFDETAFEVREAPNRRGRRAWGKKNGIWRQ